MEDNEETYIAWAWDDIEKKLVRKEYPRRKQKQDLVDFELQRKLNKSRRTNRRGGRDRVNQIQRLAERDGMKCNWCEVKLWVGGTDHRFIATIDHYPISKAAGGNNSDENAVLSCGPCNVDRSAGKAGQLRIEERKAWVQRQRARSLATQRSDGSQESSL